MGTKKPAVLDTPPASSFDPTRREVISRLGQAAILTAAGAPLLSAKALAQSPTAAPAPTPQEQLVPGTVGNAEVMSGKDPAMKMYSERPLTASVTAEYLNDSVTATKRVFVRNNLLTPIIEEGKHQLKVSGLVDRPLEFSMEELKKSFPHVTMQGMLECAGSGRTGFNPTPRGTPWPPTGGMSCPKWTGVRLKDVLKAAGIKPNVAHVAFFGADFGAVVTVAPMVRSIPVSKAMEANTLLAWAMNDEPLPAVHGFPLRAVIPGWAGSASGKWLKEIQALDAPFKGTYMDDSYRLPLHPVAPGDKMPAERIITEAWPVKSIITSPVPGAKFKVGQAITIDGKAWAGDNTVTKVEVSLDEGVTWQRATVYRQGDEYAWRQFSFEFRPDVPGYMTCLARATDNRGNVQPISAQWNPLGYFWNGLHRVGVLVEKA